MLYDNPKGLLDSVTKLMSESKAKFDQEKRELEEAQKALWEKKMGKKPLHPNQQKLDVHEPEKDELTAKDLEMLRAGKKAMKNEDVEQVQELKASTLGSYIKKAAYDAKGKGFDAGSQQGWAMAKSKEMFGGVEAGSETDDKAHKRLGNIKKATNKLVAKSMKEAAELDEARGRPRKNPVAGAETEDEPDQNIVMHLKKSRDTGGNHDVKFADKTTHKVPAHVATNVLSAMGKLKPADRLEVQKHIQQNHKNLMQVHGMIK